MDDIFNDVCPMVREHYAKFNLPIVFKIYNILSNMSSRGWYHFRVDFNFTGQIDYILCYNQKKLVVSYDAYDILNVIKSAKLCEKCNWHVFPDVLSILKSECYICDNSINGRIAFKVF